MALTGYTTSNELVRRGPRAATYEEVMQRKIFKEDIVEICPGDSNNHPDNKFKSLDEFWLKLKFWIEREIENFMEKTEHNWFDITYSWAHDYHGSSIRVYAHRYETDKEYFKRITAWQKRQDAKLKREIK